VDRTTTPGIFSDYHSTHTYGECWKCNGTGSKTLECTLCDGTGNCNRCHGEGRFKALICQACHGIGQRDSRIAPCSRCKGTGLYKPEVDCPKCGGNGQCKCSGGTFTVTCCKCQGSGRFSKFEWK
jgi:DnaJ-class molecular chaperone